MAKKPTFCHKIHPDPICIFQLFQIHVTSTISSKTAEKPEHFLCNIIHKTMSASPKTTHQMCQWERKIGEEEPKHGFICFHQWADTGLGNLWSERKEAMLHLSENQIKFWVAFVAGCLYAPKHVYLCLL